MKQIHGLESLAHKYPSFLHTNDLAALLTQDLQHCRCLIFGSDGEVDNIVLAELSLLTDSLYYDNFDHRIDLIVAGPIIRNDHVPLTYALQGAKVTVTGRCSMISGVCGVDLYLQRSYTGVVGDIARQKFSIAIKPLLKKLKLG